MKTFSRVAIATLTMVGMSGIALADTPAKADPKAPPAKADPKAPGAGSGSAAAAPAMQMPKPAPEIADTLKQMQGTWNCTGTAVGPDMKSEAKFKATMTSKSDLDGFWIHDSMTGTAGEGKTAMKFKMESYSTFDPAAKKWHRVSMMNDGAMMTGVGDAMNAGKADTVSDTWSPMGSGQFKDHVDASDMKKGVHMWGEMSMDKGKTFNKVYEMTCKK
jgi:hypothetical protein